MEFDKKKIKDRCRLLLTEQVFGKLGYWQRIQLNVFFSVEFTLIKKQVHEGKEKSTDLGIYSDSIAVF